MKKPLACRVVHRSNQFFISSKKKPKVMVVKELDWSSNVTSVYLQIKSGDYIKIVFRNDMLSMRLLIPITRR
ncbi:hypothetical protein CFP56_019593 [Quercus suber]|uniref:Uncharacterized protein n=1 Tax=Quercus suber TaxID=58331 RepID=A0AAW0KGC3_QUESU